MAMMSTATDNGLLPFRAAAVELKVGEATLRRWIARGAPVSRRGHRGRGRATLLDVAAIRAWRAPTTTGVDPRILAAVLPERIATALHEAHQHVVGPGKRAAAGVLAGAWHVACCAVTEELRRYDEDILDVGEIPESVERLQKIAAL